MLVTTRFAVTASDREEFTTRAADALEALSARPGFQRGWVGQAADDPDLWVIATLWDGVGAYRRALSAYDVKMRATPLLAQAIDEPGAYVVVASRDGQPE